MLMGLMPTVVFAEGSTVTADITGEGTAENPYLIYTAAGLKEFRDIVNGENGKIKKSDAHAKLMSDIVLNDGTFDKDGNYTPGESGKAAEEWTPIGWYENINSNSPYTGTFDGGGYTIKGVYVTGEQYAGLFGSISGGTVKNVAVTGYVEGTRYVGGIVGYGTYATVSDCTNHAAVKAKNEIFCVGGIAGCVGEQGIITGCTNTGTVTAFPIDGSNYWGLGDVGGIVGYGSTGSMKNPNAVSITACANLGEVSVFIDSDKAGAYVGGIAGAAVARTIPTDCFNAGDISITERNATCGESSLGGIVGLTEGSVTDPPRPYTSNCYSVGTLTHTGSGPVGICGIVGYAQSTLKVDRCYWLKGMADDAAGGWSNITNTSAKSKKEFANGTVLNLLKGDRTDSPWADECQYVAAAGMTLPVFKGQGDSHTHSEKTGNCLDGIYCECGYLMHGATSGHNWGEWQHLTTSHTRTCKNPGCGVTQSGNCSGGTATCKDRAICEICGKSYGELDANNHADLKHIEAKAATKTAEGNIEYWHCEGCGKYFADKDGAKEITKADTVTAKLPDDSKSPQTGDTSNLMLWFALLFISSGAVTATTVYGRKKKRLTK